MEDRDRYTQLAAVRVVAVVHGSIVKQRCP
jgi:hypothetical protein